MIRLEGPRSRTMNRTSSGRPASTTTSEGSDTKRDTFSRVATPGALGKQEGNDKFRASGKKPVYAYSVTVLAKCERERGDDVNMTSTCKGVGPLGMPVTGLTEPYLETGNRGELWRDTGGFLRESSECVRYVRETLFSLSTLLRPPGAQRRLCLRGHPWADSYRPVVLHPRSPIAW